jgi:phosphopantothenoylcysteine decarboxylase / phosphopantothenate---cysteine ligase
METKMDVLNGKRIVLGVCGSIAAYKAAQFARDLTLAGAHVSVIMTEAAQRFVGTATFQALTGRPVLTDMWSLPEDGVVGHVALGARADMVIVAPATAQTLARLALGMADDLLASTVLATRAPLLIAPAMNPLMYDHPATQAHIAALRERGAVVIEPAVGRMAEDAYGRGRLPEPFQLMAEARALFGRTAGPLRGRRVVVTAGGTYEPIDPVRFIGNRASGQMGYALAEAARDRGAAVTLISGPTSLPRPYGLEFQAIETAAELRSALHESLAAADLLVMNAAVADYRPAVVHSGKLKKRDGAQLTLTLDANPDLLAELSGVTTVFKVGFAAETDDLLSNAAAKLRRKGLQLIVANDAVRSIGRPTISLHVLDGQETVTLPELPKAEAAARLWDVLLPAYERWAAARAAAPLTAEGNEEAGRDDG